MGTSLIWLSGNQIIYGLSWKLNTILAKRSHRIWWELTKSGEISTKYGGDITGSSGFPLISHRKTVILCQIGWLSWSGQLAKVLKEQTANWPASFKFRGWGPTAYHYSSWFGWQVGWIWSRVASGSGLRLAWTLLNFWKNILKLAQLIRPYKIVMWLQIHVDFICYVVGWKDFLQKWIMQW